MPHSKLPKFASLFLFLLMFAGMGCASRRSPVPLTVELGYDPTPPDAEERARQVAAITPSFTAQDTFTLLATDHKTTVISTLVPEDDAATYAVLQTITARVVPVTDLANFFEAVATGAETSDHPVIIFLYTDGLDDGELNQAAARIEAAAHRLAKNPQVRAVILVGLVREIRPGWKGLPEMLDCLNEGQKRLVVQPQGAMNPEEIEGIIAHVRATTPQNLPNNPKGNH